MNNDRQRIAHEVRDACLAAALAAYEEAGISGLCAEGRWECAIGAIKNINLDNILPDRDVDGGCPAN